MRSRLIYLAASTLLATPIWAGSHASPDMVVATVGEKEITLAHMIVLKAQLPQEYRQLPPELIFDGLLDQLVQQTLLGESVEDLTPGSRAALENRERELYASEAIAALAEAAVTEDAVNAAYAARVAQSSGEKEWEVSHILFAQEDGMEPGAAKAEAEATIAELQDGADFSDLARERSDGPSAPAGGELGWWGAEGLVEPFAEAMMAMEPGSISAEPVETRFGWHVLRVTDVRDKAMPPLEELRPQIVEELRRAAVEAAIAEARKDTPITRKTTAEVDPALLDDVSLLEGR